MKIELEVGTEDKVEFWGAMEEICARQRVTAVPERGAVFGGIRYRFKLSRGATEAPSLPGERTTPSGMVPLRRYVEHLAAKVQQLEAKVAGGR